MRTPCACSCHAVFSGSGACSVWRERTPSRTVPSSAQRGESEHETMRYDETRFGRTVRQRPEEESYAKVRDREWRGQVRCPFVRARLSARLFWAVASGGLPNVAEDRFAGEWARERYLAVDVKPTHLLTQLFAETYANETSRAWERERRAVERRALRRAAAALSGTPGEQLRAARELLVAKVWRRIARDCARPVNLRLRRREVCIASNETVCHACHEHRWTWHVPPSPAQWRSIVTNRFGGAS